MPSKTLKDIVTTHFETLFPETGAVVLKVLRNDENPKQPQSRVDLLKAHVWLSFPPTQEKAEAIGAVNVPWDESGAFMVHVGVDKYSGGDDLLDQTVETVRSSLRNISIDESVDIHGFFESDAGDRFDGNWHGQTFAVEFYRPGEPT